MAYIELSPDGNLISDVVCFRDAPFLTFESCFLSPEEMIPTVAIVKNMPLDPRKGN